MSPVQHMEEIAVRLLGRLGFEVCDAPPSASCDLVASRRGERYRALVRVVRPYRRADAEGRVADAVLRLTRAGNHKDGRPLVMLGLERLTERAQDDLTSYLASYAPEVDWVLFDASGQAGWRLNDRFGEEREPSRRPPAARPPRRTNPFSPLNQWMLKILLMGGSDPAYWGGPSVQPRNVSHWAELAGGSQPQASLLLSSLERDGQVVRDHGGFRVLDVVRLMHQWAEHHRPRVLLAKPLFPVEKPAEHVFANLHREPDQGVVGGHAACRLLGLGVVNVDALRLYVREPVERALQSLELVPAREGEAGAIEVVPARKAPSVFGGALERQGVLVTDALQCWLDVRYSPLRGEEQARAVFDVLARHFEELGWL